MLKDFKLVESGFSNEREALIQLEIYAQLSMFSGHIWKILK